MIIYDEPLATGWPSTVFSTLRRKVGALSRHQGYHQKVGITNFPERRWNQAYALEGWNDMRVIYVSTSYAHVCERETWLIDAFRDGLVRPPGYFYNARGGGGGRPPATGPYYLYVVNAPRWSRMGSR